MSNDQPLAVNPPIAVTLARSAQELAKLMKISEDFYTVFSNYMRIAMSQDDVRLFVGEIFPTATNEIVATENFCIAMSPERAKALLSALAQGISGYEKMWGEIKPLTPIGPQAATEPAVRQNPD